MKGGWSKRYLMGAALAAMVAGGLFLAACDATGPTAPLLPEEDMAAAPGSADVVVGQPNDAPKAGLAPGGTVAPIPFDMAKQGGGCSGDKVTICHLPPGNPGNIQEVCISTNAVPAHEAHGDYAPLAFWPDADGDGFGDATAMAESGCTVPPGYVENSDDCDDWDATINPNATEVCDGVDNNCDGQVDEGGVCVTCPCWTAEDLLEVAEIVTARCEEVQPGALLLEGFGRGGFFEQAVVTVPPYPGGTLCATFLPPQPPVVIPVSLEEAAACYDSLAAECTRRGF